MNCTKKEMVKAITISLIVLITGTKYAIAGGLDEPLRHKLKEISIKMATEENDKFVVVEAMSDGLIIEGNAYSLTYVPGSVMIDGKQLPEPMHSKYTTLLGTYFKIKNKIGSVTFFQIKDDDGIWVNQIERDLLKSSDKEQSKTVVLATPEKDYTPVINEMLKSGKISTDRKATISYDGNKVFINGKQLPATEEQKYKDLFFNTYSITPVDGGTVTIGRTN